MPDHARLRAQGGPQVGVHRVVKALKGYTSQVRGHEFASLKRRMPSLWTPAHLVETWGAAHLDEVKRSIEGVKDR